MINSVLQFIEALEHEELSFSSLKGVEVIKSADGSLYCIAGGEAVIFKVSLNGGIFALKCYMSDRKNRKQRYEMLKKVSEAEGVVLAMTYLENELSVIDNYGVQKQSDVLLYPWVDGITLLEAIEKCVEYYDTVGLAKLNRDFMLMARELVALPITHGDLKPQNTIVGSDGKMSVIDYDMVFSKDMPCDEIVRTQWYQHPLAEAWDEGYAIAVIAVSLFLLSLDPHLFHKYHNGENILIDTHKIIRSGVLHRELSAMLVPYPNYTALFEIVASPNPLYKDITPLLANTCGAKTSCKVIDEQGILRRVVCEKGLYGFIDRNDNLVVGCCYGDATPFNDGVAGVCLNGSWYIFDVTGRVAVNKVFDEISVSECDRIPVSKSRKWFYLNSFTFERINAAEYDYAYPFSSGFGLVRAGNRFYFLDAKGEKPFGAKTFRFARPFVNGYAVVADDGYFVIDVYGRRVSAVIEERILNYDGKYLYYRDSDNVVKSMICET